MYTFTLPEATLFPPVVTFALMFTFSPITAEVFTTVIDEGDCTPKMFEPSDGL